MLGGGFVPYLLIRPGVIGTGKSPRMNAQEPLAEMYSAWAGEMARHVKVLAAKPDGLRALSLAPTGWRDRTTPTRCPLISIHSTMHASCPTPLLNKQINK